MDTYFKFVIVREPFHRLLSAYRDKLDHSESEYFDKVELKLREIYKNTENSSTERLTFAEYIKYLTDPDRMHLNEHWNYYHKLCYPCSIQYDFVGHMEDIDIDMKYVLHRLSITNVEYSQGQAPVNRSDTFKENAYYSKVPPSDVNKLYHAYELDYKLFGYPPPPQF